MGVSGHLGIRLTDYDARIRTFIPRYEEMLGAAAAALTLVNRRAPVVIDLGVGSGALAARCLSVAPGAIVVGIDADEGMLALARKRMRGRMLPVAADFTAVRLPRCDAIVTSFALHHVPTRTRKAKLYRACYSALRPSGIIVNADCCLASSPRLQARYRMAWRMHLERAYSPQRAEGCLRAWAKEDFYFRLEDEIELLRTAGFTVDVPWRRDDFAVVVGVKPARRR